MNHTARSQRSLPDRDPAWEEVYLRATGLSSLSPTWAKVEIVGGLAAAAGGLKLLLATGHESWSGAALMVLGLYLAMAGHRSHLYQSQNRQAAYLAQILMAEIRSER